MGGSASIAAKTRDGLESKSNGVNGLPFASRPDLWALTVCGNGSNLFLSVDLAPIFYFFLF